MSDVKKGRPPIIDEFTNLPCSRQQKYILRNRRDKRCIRCGGDLSSRSTQFCDRHLEMAAEEQRRRKAQQWSWASPSERDELLEAVEEVPANAAGWRRAHCPFCPTGVKKNLAMKDDSGWCQCWRCGIRAWLYGPPEEADNDLYEPDPLVLGTVPLPYGYEPLEQDPLPRHLTGYVSYLYHQRKVPVEAILDVGIGACTKGDYAGMVIVPVDVAGMQRGWVARAVLGKKYSTPPGFARHLWLFNQDALQEETSEPLAIVEGVFSALPHWPFAAACLGQPTDEQLDVIAGAKRPIVSMLDADAQANGVALYRRLLLRGVDARAAKLPPGKDPGNIPHEHFMSLLHSDYYAS